MEREAVSGAVAPVLRKLRTALWGVAIGAAVLCTSTFLFGAIDLMPAPEAVDAASIVALGAATAALLLSPFIAGKGRRVGSVVRLVMLPPVFLVAMVVVVFVADVPGVINRVTLPDGRKFLLGVGNMPTDVDYQLWGAVDPYGLLWSRPEDTDLTWSEDGRLTEDPALVVSANGKWLLVRRGGLWTDCFEATKPIRWCRVADIESMPDWQKPEEWVQRSKDIEALTGVAPASTAKPRATASQSSAN